MSEKNNHELAIFAGGCFWCLESAFREMKGVARVVSGYTGGTIPNPTYEQVCSGTTGHVEAVEIEYDPGQVTYEELLERYWLNIDPTDAGGQFVDRGSQYRSVIFVMNKQQQAAAEESKRKLGLDPRFKRPVVTEIKNAGIFYPAEEYHQEYDKKFPGRYKLYVWGSGRESGLKQLWQDGQANPDMDWETIENEAMIVNPLSLVEVEREEEVDVEEEPKVEDVNTPDEENVQEPGEAEIPPPDVVDEEPKVTEQEVMLEAEEAGVAVVESEIEVQTEQDMPEVVRFGADVKTEQAQPLAAQPEPVLAVEQPEETTVKEKDVKSKEKEVVKFLPKEEPVVQLEEGDDVERVAETTAVEDKEETVNMELADLEVGREEEQAAAETISEEERLARIGKLTPMQQQVTQQCGTEPPFANEYWDEKREGIYVDIVSGEVLFSSQDKYDSGTGWPSFTKPVGSETLVEEEDTSGFVKRIEVKSRQAGSHLGHVFGDGPKEAGGLRYCINSAALRFIPKEEMEKEGYGEWGNEI